MVLAVESSYCSPGLAGSSKTAGPRIPAPVSPALAGPCAAGWGFFSGIPDAGWETVPDVGREGATDTGLVGMADVGWEAVPDVGWEGAMDAGLVGMADAGWEAVPDAGWEGATDAGLDGMADAGWEAVPDAGLDGIADAGLECVPDVGREGAPDAGPGGVPGMICIFRGGKRVPGTGRTSGAVGAACSGTRWPMPISASMEIMSSLPGIRWEGTIGILSSSAIGYTDTLRLYLKNIFMC